ncbi:MAG: molybdenum cofactor biosynthesis protein MoaE [Thermoguttaceae bacterium]|jgi:molybdopterin synthase catalytic subunit|nr:molybdenum cofactor biosynthesis protein MoaE [Thermoguttaceae bacterium]
MENDQAIQLTRNPIDPQRLLEAVQSPAAGAVVLFLGTVREWTGQKRTVALNYEAYPEMARDQLARLVAEAQARWSLSGCAVEHRLGPLEIGETSVAIAVSSAHRRAAFEAGQWLIDRIKEAVPIWKQERYADGATEWVHPEEGRPPGAV